MSQIEKQSKSYWRSFADKNKTEDFGIKTLSKVYNFVTKPKILKPILIIFLF